MSPQNWIRQGDVPRVMIPIAIFPRLVLGLPAARVYAALAVRANNTTGLVDSTREQIAEDSGLSVTQVKSGLRLLIEHGWITRERQGNGRTSSKHRMHASPVVSPAETVVEGGGNPPPSGSENNPPGGRETDRVGNPTPRGAEIRPEGGGNPPPLLSLQSSCLSKDLSPVASLPDGEAHGDLFGQPLAVVHEIKSAKTATKSDEYTPEFETWWQAYPKRDGGRGSKAAAFKNWQKAIKTVRIQTLMAAVAKYAQSKAVLDGYAMDATRWLGPNEKGWEVWTEEDSATRVTFDSLRAKADAATVSRLIRVPWADPFQHPDDTSPRPAWLRARRLEFIDHHRDAIVAALTKAS